MLTRRDIAKGLATGAIGAITIPLLPDGSVAQEGWPSAQPIRTIAMFPPGSGADILIRFYANKLTKFVGKSVITENKPGAFGNIATETVIRSKPDGYTIYIAPGSSVLAAAPSLFKKVNYDPVKDLEHVTTLSKLAFMLCVAADSPFKTVADLTEYLKKQGDKANYGSIANTGLVGSALYLKAFDLKTVEVKYKEPQALYADLINGNLAFMHIDPLGIAAMIKQGKVRALAMTSAERMKSLPDVPGAREAGIPNCDLIAWWSVHTPAKTPQPVLDKLEAWFNEIAVDPETVQFLAAGGTDPFPGNGKMLRELLIKDTAAWAEYVKIARIDPV